MHIVREVGVCSALGPGDFLDLLCQAEPSPEACIDARPPVYRTRPQLEPALARQLRRADPAVLVAADAVSRLNPAAFSAVASRALVVGSARSVFTANAGIVSRFCRAEKPLPTQVAASSPASIIGTLGALVGANGPAFVVSAACASGATAIGVAADLLTAGHHEAVAGGVDSPLHPALVSQFQAAGVLAGNTPSPRLLRPFDIERSGTLLGEGAAFLRLQSGMAGAGEGSIILQGWGMNSAVGERQRPDESGRGLAAAIDQALHRAAMNHKEISAIVLHGNGTVVGDEAEFNGLLHIFGQHLENIPCTAIKPLTGHCFAGSSAMEAALAVLMLKKSIIPPTRNTDRVAFPGLNLVLAQAQTLPSSSQATVLVVSSGFWGNHAALLFRRI